MRRLCVQQTIERRGEKKTIVRRSKPLFFSREGDEIPPLTGMSAKALEVLRAIQTQKGGSSDEN